MRKGWSLLSYQAISQNHTEKSDGQSNNAKRVTEKYSSDIESSWLLLFVLFIYLFDSS